MECSHIQRTEKGQCRKFTGQTSYNLCTIYEVFPFLFYFDNENLYTQFDDFVMINVPNENMGGRKMNYLLTSTFSSHMMLLCTMENFAVKL